MDIQQLKFPIGEYVPNKNPDGALLKQWIKEIEEFPSKVEHLAKDISVAQLNWKYRPDGWTVKQVIHHCADSHMNCLIRFKLALTEETPTIKPYFEDRWAKLPDYEENDITDSLILLKILHKKLGTLLKGLTEDQLQLSFIHPEHNRKFTLAETIGMYAWHSNHHLAHIKNGIETEGKYN